MKVSNSNFGQPWQSAGKFSDYSLADELRKSIQSEIDEKGREGAQVKVKRMADDTFVVKVREPREEKKTKKKRKNTKNK